MDIGYIGLGKMGLGMATLMKEKGHNVVAYNRSEEPRGEARRNNITVADSISEMISNLPDRKIIWMMVSHTAVDTVLDNITSKLKQGDIIIDGGNSRFTETIKRSQSLLEKGIHYIDAGVSGGPSGARNGACIMVGGDRDAVSEMKQLFVDIAVPNGYEYVGKSGAGHFVKMVHNGIEYGMMQSIAEGFALMKKSDFDLDLKQVTSVYQNGSVIESRLVGWLGKAYEEYGLDLDDISGKVNHSGEGLWTVQTAKDLDVPVEVIEKSLQFREYSQSNPSYTGKVVSALRNQFGGHNVKKENE